MAQNFLYLFDFVVDELLVTRPNFCAPEEYPTCCEISFRNSVFISICDREFGQCVDPSATKCGKCCLFSLESPITEADRLMIHIYKKKTDKCKFLVGCTDLPVKGLFDKVMENFNILNVKWEEGLRQHTESLPMPKAPGKPVEIVDNDCDEDTEGRREQLCPASELTKRFLPIFNLKGCQTGNVVLIIRLVANGPAIVSTFPFGKICNSGCGKKSSGGNELGSCSKPCAPSSRCEAGEDTDCRKDKCKEEQPTTSKPRRQHKSPCNGCPPLLDPCVQRDKSFPCRRYFACNADKGCPCDNVEDECDRAAKCRQEKAKQMECCACPPKPKPSCPCPGESSQSTGDYSGDDMTDVDGGASCSVATCDDTVKDPCSPCGPCMQPCFVTPRPPEPGPDAYDEFEACLNGSGIVIRVLKDSHCVETIYDGTEEGNGAERGSDTECGKPATNTQAKMSTLLERSHFARNHVKRRTGGSIINHPKLPTIRANIKYSGNETCCPDSFYVPFSNIKKFCNEQKDKVDSYRSRRQRGGGNPCDEECGPMSTRPPIHPDHNKSCCVQVDRDDIRNALKGINTQNKKKGIEVCYKACDDHDTDVFLIKLGSKQKCQRKKNNIEIELKTPKEPIILPCRHVTTETQINEEELDEALANSCRSKKKGKKGKKGK